MNADGFSPLSKQQADALSIMGPTYTLGKHAANINGRKFTTKGTMLILGDRICYLESVRSKMLDVYYYAIPTTKRSMGSSFIKAMLTSESNPWLQGFKVG